MTTGKTPEFTINRTFDAPRELVWRAWTEEKELAQWFRPMGVTTESVSVDLRVGGRYRYTMVNDETGEQHPTGGEYLEIVPVERLVMSWGEPEAAVGDAAVITLTFTERGDVTDMLFHLRGFDRRPGDANVYDGWDEALTNLATHLEGSR
ncbi:MAG: SRPBCC family protein [Mycobacteriaceae bacterium]|uniref:SRPBCC family protein n=1 Tax=Corynebacterium sp. TaxID=1720 RepID=UPI003F9B831B